MINEKTNACDEINLVVIYINEVIRAVSNFLFLFFFMIILYTHKKHKKEYKVPKDIFKLFIFFFMIRFYTHKKDKKDYKVPKDKKSTKTQPSKSTKRK